MNNNEIPIGIFIDLSKAFDTINHKILLSKLKFYGLDESALALMTSYLEDRKQYVVYKGVQSNLNSITTEVPQGSVLGPWLFLIYINDMHNVTKKFHFLCYADDTTLLGSIKDFDS